MPLRDMDAAADLAETTYTPFHRGRELDPLVLPSLRRGRGKCSNWSGRYTTTPPTSSSS